LVIIRNTALMGFKDRQAARQGIRHDNRQEQVNDMTAEQRAKLDQKKAENQDKIDEQRAKAQGRKDNARAEADRFKVCKQHINI